MSLKGARLLTVSSYGSHPAVIEAGAADGLVAEGVDGLTIRSLLIRGAGRESNDGTGIRLIKSSDIRVGAVDISGFRLAGLAIEGCRNATIEHVYAHENGGAGIGVNGGESGVPRSSHITIRDCRAIDNPGDPKNLKNHSGNGIVVGGVDHCLIEYCEAANNGWDMPWRGNGPVGIWAWNASHVTIRRCISHGNRSPAEDGGGFDLDGGVKDSILEDNLSYGNEGTGLLLCQYRDGAEWKKNVVRNNVSFDDGSRNTQSGLALYIPRGMSNMSNCLVEHNTIVNPRHAVSTIGDLPGFVYRANVYVSGQDVFGVGWGQAGFSKSRFEGNLAWPDHVTGASSPFKAEADWRKAGGLVADPRIRLPEKLEELPTDPRLLKAMRWFRPAPGSPCLESDRIVIGADLSDSG